MKSFTVEFGIGRLIKNVVISKIKQECFKLGITCEYSVGFGIFQQNIVFKFSGESTVIDIFKMNLQTYLIELSRL